MTKTPLPATARVCMLVTTNVTDDPRVMKEGSALAQGGYEVIAFGARQNDTQLLYEVVEGIVVERVDFWHLRLSRWLKQRRGIPPDQGLFVAETSATWRSQVRQNSAWVIHQIQYLIHLLTVFIVFYRSAVRERAALYHAHDLDTLLPALLAGWRLQRPVIYDSHELWYAMRADQPFANWLICALERFALPRCQGVITSSPLFAERIMAFYHIPPPTLVMNVPIYSSGAPPLPLNDTDPVQLLYHGGYQRGRGLEQLIEAMAYVQSSVHLTMRGLGAIEQKLRHQVTELGLQERVTFVPPVSMNQLVEAARDCHIGVIPYTPESGLELALPNKTFEYMAAGLAVLANNMPAVQTVIDTYQIGVVYATPDPKALAQIIDEMGRDRERLTSYRQKAWEVYHHHFTWNEHRHVLYELYARMGVAPNR